MSNKKTSYSSYITKVSEKNYRVNFSYISPDTNERKRTCKRGFEKKKDAEEWIKLYEGCSHTQRRNHLSYEGAYY